MNTERKQDLLFAILLSIPIILAFIIIGDPLYLDWWYYTLILGLPILLSLAFKPQAFFITGVSFSANLTLWFYWILCLNYNNEGLMGLGHLFSLPFWGLGWLAGIIFKSSGQTKSRAFWSGFLFPTIGFTLGQGIILLLYIK